jgi:4-hydroxy 2-oxovalerate aldolase
MALSHWRTCRTRKDYPADLIRVAAPKSAAEEATAFAAAITAKGYRTTINYMGVSNYTNQEILGLVDLMNRFKDEVDYFYVADSFGSLMPKRTREIFTTLRFGTDAALGFHPHNNLQLAFANCLEAMEAGVDVIDGSVFGMGRGAGNLFTDAMLAYYEQCNPERYHLVPVLQFADLYMEAQKDSYSWGYSLPQLLSGVFHCHPNYPTNLLREKAYTADDIYGMLRHLPEANKSRYSIEQLEQMKEAHFSKLAANAAVECCSSIRDLCAKNNKRALLICGGNSVAAYQDKISKFIEASDVSVFAVNNPQPPLPADGVFFGNRRRVLQYFDQIPTDSEVIFGPEIHEGAEVNFALKQVSRVNALKIMPGGESPYPMVLPSNSAIEAILGLVQLGYQEVFICGLDGYSAAGAVSLLCGAGCGECAGGNCQAECADCR